MRSFEYYSPPVLKEALTLLDRYGEQARPLAGGTDLIVQMKSGKARPAAVVDVKKLAELNLLEWKSRDVLFIGAAVPLSKVAAWPELKASFPILWEACSMIGSFQLRNRGTVGGNVCNAAPSADSIPPLLCLGARAVIASSKETRTVPLEGFFKGPGKTALGSNELLLGIEVPAPPARSAGSYLRHTPRMDMDIAVVGAAAFLVLEDTGSVCREARLVLGAVAPTPIRVPAAEAVLKGQSLTEKIIAEAASKAAETAKPISDVRGSAEYRQELVKVLTTRVLKKAWDALQAK
jgi:CO/xanthine dehydrogenase FAD-binding subunit